ncbi:LysR family transcriptional regulator [Rhodobacteraceae bacterium]|nr:LysR family transcriptional regulator [Paracoccaceae bacterium]
MLKIKELQAFDAFMRLGAVKLASDDLEISQPMVSRLLSQLEGDVGFALFLRRKNRLTPTNEAFIFHEKVAQYLSRARFLEAEADAISKGQVGHLTIAAQPIYCETFLVDALEQFRETHPDVRVQIIDVGMAELLRMINDRRCDLAFGITLNADTFGGDLTTLGQCEARCFLPKGHPMGQADAIPLPRLRAERFVSLLQDSPLRQRIDTMMKTISVDVNISTETRTAVSVLRLVERGFGAAFIDPLAQKLSNPDKVSVHRILPAITYEIAQFVPQGRPLSAVGQAFARIVAQEIEKLKLEGLVTDAPAVE